MDSSQKSIISVCTGGRGLERGVERAFEILQWIKPRYAAYVEINSFECFNLVTQMEQGMVAPVPIWTDAKTFPGASFYGKVDWVIGGYPCPGESVAGKMEYEKYKGYLWPAFRKIVGAARPLGCFFENVENHLNGTFPEVYRDLRKMGYRVEAGIYSAQEVGAPHQRKRLFIMANSVGQHEDRLSCGEGKESFNIEEARRTVADSVGHRQQGDSLRTDNKGENEEQSRSETFRRNKKAWPARPGEQQFDWEEPRVIKSGLGCTIDGFNFREDLLRMYGNGVVEDTAELAFLDLYAKVNGT